MQRRFREHLRRRVIDLQGVWDFAFLGPVDPHSVDVSTIEYAEAMPVPGCFDATPKYAARRGVAAYRARLPRAAIDSVPAGGSLRLEIDGAHHYCLAYVDARLWGSHSGGFTRFFVDEPNPGARAGAAIGSDTPTEVVLLVDNTFGARAPLHRESFDWYQYGGLTRGVRLHCLPPTFIESVETHTVELEGPTLEVRVHYRTAHPGVSVPLELRWADELVLAEDCRLEGTSGVLTRRLSLTGARPWSPAEPRLYLLEVRLGEDDRCERIGLRVIDVREGELLLNGEPLSIRGVNRHEAHPHFGHAVPPLVQLADLQLLCELGCNFLRGSHYPQSSSLLDLCDELGICVWNEAIGWQHPAQELASPDFVDAQSAHIEEMMAMSFNHPSIVLWGILNESNSTDPSARPTYQRLLGQIRQRDGSRALTYATNHHWDDACLDLVDVVSVNAYPGWYFEPPEGIVAWLDRLLGHLRAQAPGKPLLVSEIGGGALPGFRDHNRQHWTEDYHAQILDEILGHLCAPSTDTIGVCIWQFCDCRIAQNARAAMGRPRGFNNKGIVDEFRRPKLAFDVVRKHFFLGGPVQTPARRE